MLWQSTSMASLGNPSKMRLNITRKCSTKSNVLDHQNQQQRLLIKGQTSEHQHLVTVAISRTSCCVTICKNFFWKCWYWLAKPCYSLSWAPGELKSLEISDATKCGYRRVNQIFGTETVTLHLCSMIISNMISFLIQITKADSWNPTSDSSYPDTWNQTPCTWRLLCGCNNCRDLKKLIFS